MTVEIQRLNKDLPLPQYQTDHAAGVDLYASFNDKKTMIVIPPGQRELIHTGIRVRIPCGYEMQIRPRSGLALKHGITVCNSPGTIDADYRGEIGVILINHGDEDYTVKKGDRIAQAVFSRFRLVALTEVEEINEDTERGSGGFGHTGK